MHEDAGARAPAQPRAASSTAPVGFWPRGVTITTRGAADAVRAHPAAARRPARDGTARARGRRRSTAGKPGSSTATASPRDEVRGEDALDRRPSRR